MTKSLPKSVNYSEYSGILNREHQCEQRVRRHIVTILVLTSLLVGVVIGAAVSSSAQGQEIDHCSVFGFVLDDKGSTVGPGTVYAYTDDYSLVESQPIGADGFYRIQCPAGVGLLRFEVPGSHPELQSVSVSPGQSRHLDVVVRPATATISGIVVDQLGMPIGSARVVLFAQSQGASEASATASSDGRFTLDVAPGHYSISGWAGKFAFDPVSVSISGGEQVDVTLVGVPASVRVYGQTLDESGSVVPNVKVSAYTQDGRFVGSTHSSSSGEYAINLPTGVWEIKAWRDGWTHIGSEIVIERGSLHVYHNLALRQSDAAVSGLVVDSNGNPLSSVWIEVKQPESGRWATTVQTDGSGRFAFEIAVGEWDLSLMAEGYVRATAKVRASSGGDAMPALGVAETGDDVTTGESDGQVVVVMHRRETTASGSSSV